MADAALPFELIGSLYSLTPAEQRLAEALLSGRRPAEFARSKGLSRNTVKTQLRTLYRKVGATGHGDLLRRLTPLATLVGDGGALE